MANPSELWIAVSKRRWKETTKEPFFPQFAIDINNIIVIIYFFRLLRERELQLYESEN